MSATPAPLIEFRTSTIHGTGGFAVQKIPAGTRIIEYIGELITKEESLRRVEADNEFIFELDGEHDLDGSVDWNPARLINHSCGPNCESEIDEDHVWIVAMRDIEPGEELTFNYCYDLEDYRQYPCRCGSPQCVGYMVAEDHFDHVRRQQALSAEEPVLNETPSPSV
jgi:uncharacterized protein